MSLGCMGGVSRRGLAAGSGVSETQLALAVRDKRIVLFAGSGFSRDAGLPSWSELVAALSAAFVDEGFVGPEVAAAVAALSAQHQLPAALQVLLSQVPRERVAERIRTLTTPTEESQVIPAAARWNPRGAITTNFDRETERVVSANCYRLSNSEAELKLVQTAVGSNSPFLWKVHGDIDHALDPADAKVAAGGPFMVLSRSDFTALVQGDRGRQLLAGFISVLQTYQIVFLGYSMADPDIMDLLSWLGANCQFARSSWFVGLEGETGGLPANIERLSPVGHWGELPAWIDSITRRASEPGSRRATERPQVTSSTTDRNMYLAVSRYLSDLEAPGAAERVLGAALFDELAALGHFELRWLGGRIQEILGVGPTLGAALAEATVRLLVEYGLVTRDVERVEVHPEAGGRLRERAEVAWTKERHQFFESVEVRLPGASTGLTAATRDALEATLLDLCLELGAGMASWVSRGVGGAIGWPDFTSHLQVHLHDDAEIRLADRLLRLVLLEPRDSEIPYLYRLLGATFLASTVRLDPVAAAQLRESVALYELYLDANVLLPLIVREHPNHRITKAVIEQSRRAGVHLCVLTSILNEVTSHREIARKDIRDLGGDLQKIAEIANALGPRTNVFLQGLLNAPVTGAIGARQDPNNYLGEYSNRKIQEDILAYGIEILEPDRSATTGPLYAEALTAIRDEWRTRTGHYREDVLNVHEAAQLCHIYVRRERAPERRNHVWFLSNETVLQRVFERQPSRWLLPATFPYSAWVAFLDSRLQGVAHDPGAIVRAILKGRGDAFELPSPAVLIRQRAFGDRVTSAAEEEALEFAMSDFALMRRVEEAQRTVQRRGRQEDEPAVLGLARDEAVAEISGALDAEIARLHGELDRARTRISELESTPQVAALDDRGNRKPRGRHVRPGPSSRH
jgi:predicted nucleic acid-binding protein